jgi:hypothetical protein
LVCAPLEPSKERIVTLVSDSRIERRHVATMVAGALAIVIASMPAIAQPISDPATGFAVMPPSGYAAKTSTTSGRYTVSFNVKKPDDKDTGCLIGFLHIPDKARFTQAELNGYAARPEWANEIRTTFARLYDIISLDRFEHAGALGSVVVADRKKTPGTPKRADEVRAWLVVLETPKGRISMACVAEKSSFEARQSEFVAVAQGVTLPK